MRPPFFPPEESAGTTLWILPLENIDSNLYNAFIQSSMFRTVYEVAHCIVYQFEFTMNASRSLINCLLRSITLDVTTDPPPPSLASTPRLLPLVFLLPLTA